MTKDKLNYLLEPLQMHVKFLVHAWNQNPWHICTKDEVNVYGLYGKNNRYSSEWKMQTTTLDNMFNLICKTSSFAICIGSWSQEKIKLNPYFMCNSYEEALIKKDLIVV